MLAIELNEIHATVSRSFVRPRATFPSLPFPTFPFSSLPFPACLACRTPLESVEHQGDENTRHILCIATIRRWKRCSLQTSQRGPQEFSLWQPAHRPGYYCFNQAEGGVETSGVGVYLFFAVMSATRRGSSETFQCVEKKVAWTTGKDNNM